MRTRLLLLVFVGLSALTARAQTDTLLVDFGSILSPAPWNNLTDARTGELENLINAAGFTTNTDLRIVDDFNAVNTIGTDTPDPALGFPATATGDSFFGNTSNFNGTTEPTASVELSELTPGKAYTFSIFASRNASDNRETAYTLIGATTDTVYLDATDNETQVATSTVTANADGQIRINVMPGPDNNNNFGFYYLGALRIAYAAEDPVGPSSLALVAPDGGEVWQRTKQADIRWQSSNLGALFIEYSNDAGVSWNDVATVPAFLQRYTWTVPDDATDAALVRLGTDALSDESDATFTIEADTSTCTIVVLGSSTAEGVGPTALDSAWVYMYEDYLQARYTRYRVINLAKGGYTTAQILPTGTPIPANIDKEIDEARNFTRALDFDPFAVIVNMPSNDTGNGFPKDYQLENFATLAAAAEANDIRFYPFTTQPRNYNNPANRALQACMKDSILAIYGDNAVDVWTGIASADGFILPQFDADGIHLNNAGHKQLLARVLDKQLDTIGCAAPVSVRNLPGRIITLRVQPNPFSDQINVVLPEDMRGALELELIDAQGRTVARTSRTVAAGTGALSWTPALPAEAVLRLYFLRVRSADRVGVARVLRR